MPAAGTPHFTIKVLRNVAAARHLQRQSPELAGAQRRVPQAGLPFTCCIVLTWQTYQVVLQIEDAVDDTKIRP